MAHVKVERRSMSLKQWAHLQFARIQELVVAQRHTTSGWQVRIGQYLPDGYTWDGDFQPISNGEFWGRPDGTAQFTGTVSIPDAMNGQQVWFAMRTGAEVIVYANGRMLDGLDPNRFRIILAEQAQAGQTCEIMMEAYVRSKPDDDRSIAARQIRGSVQQFFIPELLVLDNEALALKYDLDLVEALAFGEAASEEIQEGLQYQIQQLLKLFPAYDADRAALRAALPAIAQYVRTSIYRETPVLGHHGKLACVAHSHLDIAYHWKVAQTVQKNARTCLIQLRLMERYPEFTYAHTQAWTYEMLARYYPDLFAEVKQRIAEGRWEIVGGLYVEPDCNVPSAESFARQILYGKLYFLEQFGVEVDNCWLPDVFGNSAILPQILKLGGIPYFVSNKMSTWNDTNLFPHNNFLWRGLDGSEVYACVPPVHFISWMDPNDLVNHWEAFLDKTWCHESLHMYGFGDGGSGVTEEMLEAFPRLAKLPGLPHIRQTTGKEYLHTTFATANNTLPVWDGELYLEMHRGTFTTKGRLKQENRRGEFALQAVETLWTLAALQGATYPVHALRETWKKLLLNQFHDILPGSHTQPVFVEALETYQQMWDTVARLQTDVLDVLAPATGIDQQVCIINPTSTPRRGLACFAQSEDLPKAEFVLQDQAGQRYPLQNQQVPGGQTRVVTAIPELPPMSLTNFTLTPGTQTIAVSELQATARSLENRFFRLELDEQQRVTRIFDKLRQREVVSADAIANDWQLFEDKPGKYNAWDLLPQYQDHPISLPDWQTADVVERGPLSIALRLQRAFSQSRAEQIIRLHADIPRIDFETWVDWQETEKLLKVAFPVTVKARFYTTDTSAGGFERENHRNTSWQAARFEVCAHKWVDLSEGLFGVALLNDCKYGYDVDGNVLRLSLLRAPIRPDRVSDKGEHRFTYSIFTHDGDWRKGGLVEAAYALNWPLTAWRGRQGTSFTDSAVQLDAPALTCFALKCAEDGSGDVVLRLAELYGSHGTASIHVNFAFRNVWLCDLLERRLTSCDYSATTVNVPFQPYQIQTLRFTRS